MTGKFLVLGVGLLLAGCSATAKKAFLNEEYRAPGVRASFSAAAFSIIDLRETVTTRPLDVPVLSLPGTNDSINPALNEAYTRAMREEAEALLTAGGPAYDIRISVIEAKKAFYGALVEREAARVTVRVDVLDSVHQPYFYSATGEANLEMKSTNAGQDFSEKQFVKALKMAVYKAFEAICIMEKKEATPAP
jgi:hypothetical protein